METARASAQEIDGPARGTGIHEAKSFFGLSIEGQTEIILFLVEEHVVEKFMKVILECS